MTNTQNKNMKMRKLKRAVIKEELVELTGDFKEAIVLNQLIYWSERVKDSDQFLVEEIERKRKYADGSVESKEDIEENLKNGWIYKTADEMVDEVMLTVSSRTIDRIFVSLVEKEYISRRRNPKYKWDKTWQYRVNLNKIQIELNKLNYTLEGYSLINFNGDDDNEGSNEESENDGNNLGETPEKPDNDGVVEPKRQNDVSSRQNDVSSRQGDVSSRQGDESSRQGVGAIPEITTEITPKTTTEITSYSSSSYEEGNTEEEEEINNNVIPVKSFKKNNSSKKEQSSTTKQNRFLQITTANKVMTDIAQLLGKSGVPFEVVLDIIIGIEDRYIEADYQIAREQLEHCVAKEEIEPIYNFTEYYLNGLQTRSENKRIYTTDYVPEEYLSKEDDIRIPMYNWVTGENM